MSGALYVGVDGGGSHTTALLGRGGDQILGRGRAGSSNPSAVGFDAAHAEIEAAVRAALADAGLTFEQASIERMVLGVAGAGRPADRARLEALVQSWPSPPAEVRVLQDVALLLPAAGLASGVAIVAGTGSAAFGVGRDGRTETAGGWGYLLGDEGSAFWVGRAALRVVGAQVDGIGVASALTPAIISHLRLARPRDLITAVYQATAPRNAVADLAPLVVAAAREGDDTAVEIIATAGRDLAEIAIAIARRLALPAGALVVGVGGMFQAGDLLIGPLDRRLTAADLDRIRLLESDPAVGALRLASGEVAMPQAE